MREVLTTAELIPYNTFQEKVNITKEHDGKAKVEIIDNKFVLVVRMEVK